MKAYRREYPLFALCGLNCGLCPRYQTDGASKCPGCGGPDFYLKHPTCAVITCGGKHGGVEHCFECSAYPCPRYSKPSRADSFITYRNVRSDLDKARSEGVGRYRRELDRKVRILERLIAEYNDGRRKSFYCLAVNLLGLADLERIMIRIDGEVKGSDLDHKTKSRMVVEWLESAAKKDAIELVLRKQGA